MTQRPPVRIANCSGFYGDRVAAAREMLAGPIDVLTGDYLAELTMLILWKARRKDPGRGYAVTFLRQMEEVLGTCLERGVKVVANRGGLHPAGPAGRRDAGAPRAGAVVAGHIIECGPQATGGNYSFLTEITDRRYPGFPIAEVAADGGCVITKLAGTGGLVSVGTVTAQLLYEIGEPAYPTPDVVAHFDTMRVEQAGPDRVAVTGTRGSPPPETLKVALNMLGGYRNTMTMVITGLDIEAKADQATTLLFGLLGGPEAFEEADVRLLRFDHPDAPVNEQATAHLRITVKDQDERKVGRAFSDATFELALGGYAGFHTTTPPTAASAFGLYWPALVPAAVVTQLLHLPDGSVREIPHTSAVSGVVPSSPSFPPSPSPSPSSASSELSGASSELTAPLAGIPLGRLCGARSGH